MNDYQEIYEKVWERDEYRKICHGLNLWNDHQNLFPNDFSTVLDIGCGMGLLVSQMIADGYDAYGVDIARNAIDPKVSKMWSKQLFITDLTGDIGISLRPWGEGKRFDLGVCCDVMEHIHEGDVPKMLENIWEMCDEVIFVIANHASNFLGYNLHPTKMAPEWWCKTMQAIDPESWVYPEKFDRPGREGIFVIKWKRG